MQRKGVIAFGFLIGVAIVAGILRIKFYFDPPEDNFTNRNLVLLDDSDDSTELAVETVTATPQLVTTAQYTLTQQSDLGDGIIRAILETTDQVITVQLQGSELVMQPYDLSWQPLADGRRVLQTDVQLIAGLPPQVVLAKTGSGYTLGQTVAQSDSVYAVVLRTYSTDWVEQSSVTLQDNLPSSGQVVISLTTDGIWMLLNNQTVQFYGPTGTLSSTQDLTSTDTTVCDLIPDQGDIVMVMKSNTGLILQKQDRYGKKIQTVTLPQIDTALECLAVYRSGEQFVIQLVDQLIPYTDNLSEQYETIAVRSNQLFPQVMLQENSIWLLYSSSSTLGQYTMHAERYDQPVTDSVTVTPPDATTEYIN
ncbi:MAG: hypothetical protein ACD_41C00251G0002 [uncultured bacterium]|nr:MAG: hypothetical protein ACD_41C00251G0002 [uncultured bacterium]